METVYIETSAISHATAWPSTDPAVFVLQQQARLEDALAAYGRAIALRENYADAINNAGIVLQELGRSSEAIDLYRRRRHGWPLGCAESSQVAAPRLTRPSP